MYALGLLGLVLLVIYLSVRDRDMARARVEDGALVIEPRGLNKLWTLRSSVTLPLSAVTDVRVVTGLDQLPSRGFRLPGTGAPGLIIAGSYWKPGYRSFYAVHDGEDMVVIKTTGQRYDLIVLQTKDPYGTVNAITDARVGNSDTST